jgi:hypothetical protein
LCVVFQISQMRQCAGWRRKTRDGVTVGDIIFWFRVDDNFMGLCTDCCTACVRSLSEVYRYTRSDILNQNPQNMKRRKTFWFDL